MQIGVWAANGQSAANWRLGFKLAFGLQLVFWLQNGVRICSRTGSSDFLAQHILCSPYNRLCGVCGPAIPLRLFGPGHRMLPRQQALRCLRGRKSIASLQTGPSVFSGTRIAFFLDSRPCGKSFASLQTGNLVFSARASHASPITSPAVFALPQFVCVPANRPFGLFGHGHRMLPP